MNPQFTRQTGSSVPGSGKESRKQHAITGQEQSAEELVVLLDDDGNAIGTRAKAIVHTDETPLHLAFSCYVFDRDNRFLLSRRAFTKKTWPGVWTNSCCGHPGPDERMIDAVRRRLDDELGVHADRVDLILPRFRYRAVMADGIVENEICPVYRAIVDGASQPDPDEVAEIRWMAWHDVPSAVSGGLLDPFSPWCLEQLAILAKFSDDITTWPLGDEDELPPAARLASSTKSNPLR